PVTVATYHSVVPPKYKLLRMFTPLLWKVMRRLDGRIAVSDAIVGSIEPFFPGLDFQVIPNGIDVDFFSPEAEPIDRLLDDKRNLLFVGRFDPRNGLPHMLGAFELLRKKRDDCRLIVLGDGPLRSYYRRMVPVQLEHLLDHPEQARAMGAAGRRRAVEKYAFPLVADQLEELYERLGAPARKRPHLRAVATG